MLSRVPGIMRLLKLGALGGIAIGVVKAVKRRRNRAATSESTWPTLAETAMQDGLPMDDGDAGEEHESDSAHDRSVGQTADSVEHEASADDADGTASESEADSDADTDGAEADTQPESDSDADAEPSDNGFGDGEDDD